MGFILSNNDKKIKTNIISGGDDCVKSFMFEIGRYELLKRPRELKLAENIADNNSDAKTSRLELFNSNLRLVVSVAKRYLNKGLDMEDLIQEGCIGLCKAIEKYDHTTGNKFSTYATWWIRQGITRALADKAKNIRIPVHMVSLMFKYKKLIKEVESKLGRQITEREVILSLEIDKEKLALLQRCLTTNKSLDELNTNGSNDDSIGNLGDSVTNGYTIDNDQENDDMLSDLYENIEDTITVHKLCPTILSMFYGLEGNPRTQKEICKELNIPTKEFKRILNEGLELIRSNIRESLYD